MMPNLPGAASRPLIIDLTGTGEHAREVAQTPTRWPEPATLDRLLDRPECVRLFRETRRDLDALENGSLSLPRTLREPMALRFGRFHRLQAKMAELLDTEPFDGECRELMQRSLNLHRQGTWALQRLLGEFEHTQVARILNEWKGVMEEAGSLFIQFPQPQRRSFEKAFSRLLCDFDVAATPVDCARQQEKLQRCVDLMRQIISAGQTKAMPPPQQIPAPRPSPPQPVEPSQVPAQSAASMDVRPTSTPTGNHPASTPRPLEAQFSTQAIWDPQFDIFNLLGDN